MNTLWQRLNEKKTIIGAGLFLAAMLLRHLLDIWYHPTVPDWGPKWVATLELFGGVFSGVGLGHKGIKKLQSKQG